MRRVKDAIRHVAPGPTVALTRARRSIVDRNSAYVALDRCHAVSTALGPGVRIEIDSDGVWLVTAEGLYWRHVAGVYGPFLGLEKGEGFEPTEVTWAAGVLQGGGVLLDVGANIGVFSVNILRASPSATAIAVEPALGTFGSLVANVDRNGVGARVTTINAAIGEAPGQITVTSGLNAANHVVARAVGEARAGEQRIRQVTIDAIAAERALERLDLIKMDIEGFELPALRGGIETIRRFRPQVFLEIESRWTERYGYRPAAIFDLFSSLDYEHLYFRDGTLVPGSDDIAADLSFSNNFVFRPR
jgi:FkbM family methyltransferase